MVRLALAIALLATPAAADGSWRIIDGDTMALGEERVRLVGIDAPELRDVCEIAGRAVPVGELARDQLRLLVEAGSPLLCEALYHDRWGRAVSICTMTDGTDLSGAMVSLGWARDWPRYSGGAYAQFEREWHPAVRCMEPPG